MRVCAEVQSSRTTSSNMGGLFHHTVDTVYLGGGTPTLLDVPQLERVFVTIRQNFEVAANAEITVECAPGTLTVPVLDVLVRCGVNRVSLGVQSFIDHEAASVGRLHKRAVVLDDIARLRAAGISSINIDLIAGLPHQSPDSWKTSLDELIATSVPHASVYMLEVDEDSRLGRELLAGGQKYHAHFVPDEDFIADQYELACERLNAASIRQYEISNFSRPGFESKHNLKYWTRQPYLGFGVDAHSMLPLSRGRGAVRFANPDSLEKYVAGAPFERIPVSADAGLQEAFFLGLRLNCGVELSHLGAEFGEASVAEYDEIISELASMNLLEADGNFIRLTPRGRLLSNEVFERFATSNSAPQA